MKEAKIQAIKLIIMIVISTGFFGVEIVYGHYTKSLALVSDSYNMLSDVMSLILGLVCLKLSKKESKKNTFGWARSEIIGALINAVFLVALCFSIFTESIERLIEIQEIKEPMTLLIVGSVGLGVNVFGMILFFNDTFGNICKKKKKKKNDDSNDSSSSHGSVCKDQNQVVTDVTIAGHDDAVFTVGKVVERSEILSHPKVEENEDHVEIEIDEEDLDFTWMQRQTKKMKTGSQMNIQSVFLHIMGDALGSIVVVISALVVLYCEGEWRFRIDPGLSIVMVVIIVGSTIPLIKQTSFILLQHLPKHMKVTDLIRDMSDKVRGLKGVHELHVWQLVGSRMVASLHVNCSSLDEYVVTSRKIKRFFHNYGIHSTTIQPEFAEQQRYKKNIERECSLECGPDLNCYADTCCGQKKKSKSSSSSSTVFEPLALTDSVGILVQPETPRNSTSLAGFGSLYGAPSSKVVFTVGSSAAITSAATVARHQEERF